MEPVALYSRLQDVSLDRAAFLRCLIGQSVSMLQRLSLHGRALMRYHCAASLAVWLTFMSLRRGTIPTLAFSLSSYSISTSISFTVATLPRPAAFYLLPDTMTDVTQCRSMLD